MRVRNYALLVFLGVTWGSSFLFVELGLRNLEPLTLAASRIVIGGAILLAVLLVSGVRPPRDLKTWGMLFAMSIIGVVAPFILISAGQTMIPSSRAAILVATVPIWTLVLAHMFTDDRITPSKAVGVAVGTAGFAVLIGPDAFEGMTENLLGQLMVVGGTVAYAIQNVMARRLSGTSSLFVGTAVLLLAVVTAVPIAFVFERPLAAEVTPVPLLGIAGLGLLSTGLAFLALFRLTASAGPNFVSTNIYIGACVGVTWGVVLLDEPISWRMIAALVITLAGVLVATYSMSGRRRAVPREPV